MAFPGEAALSALMQSNPAPAALPPGAAEPGAERFDPDLQADRAQADPAPFPWTLAPGISDRFAAAALPPALHSAALPGAAGMPDPHLALPAAPAGQGPAVGAAAPDAAPTDPDRGASDTTAIAPGAPVPAFPAGPGADALPLAAATLAVPQIPTLPLPPPAEAPAPGLSSALPRAQTLAGPTTAAPPPMPVSAAVLPAALLPGASAATGAAGLPSQDIGEAVPALAPTGPQPDPSRMAPGPQEGGAADAHLRRGLSLEAAAVAALRPAAPPQVPAADGADPGPVGPPAAARALLPVPSVASAPPVSFMSGEAASAPAPAVTDPALSLWQGRIGPIPGAEPPSPAPPTAAVPPESVGAPPAAGLAPPAPTAPAELAPRPEPAVASSQAGPLAADPSHTAASASTALAGSPPLPVSTGPVSTGPERTGPERAELPSSVDSRRSAGFAASQLANSGAAPPPAAAPILAVVLAAAAAAGPSSPALRSPAVPANAVPTRTPDSGEVRASPPAPNLATLPAQASAASSFAAEPSAPGGSLPGPEAAPVSDPVPAARGDAPAAPEAASPYAGGSADMPQSSLASPFASTGASAPAEQAASPAPLALAASPPLPPAAETGLPRAAEAGPSPSTPALGPQLAAAVARFPDRPVELTLSPEELGRVRLTLSTSEAGLVLAVTAERPETLDLMRRNIDQLARDFREIGFSDLSFSFTQQDRPAPRDPQTAPPDPAAPAPPPAAPQPAAAPTAPKRPAAAAGLDLRI